MMRFVDGDGRRGEDQTWVPFGARGRNAKGLDGFDVRIPLKPAGDSDLFQPPVPTEASR